MQTVLGALKLLTVTGDNPKTLRQSVTSKGGTTEAAIKILEENELEQTIAKALFAAKIKSKDLGKELNTQIKQNSKK